MKTGEIVDELGVYVTECCDEEVVFDLGDTFSRCPACSYPCEWEYEAELLAPEDAEHIDGNAA